MSKLRILCNLSFLTVLFLAASLSAYAGPAQLNLNLDLFNGNLGGYVTVTPGGSSSGDMQTLTCDSTGSCFFVNFAFVTAASPLSTTGVPCNGATVGLISTCLTMTYGAGGLASISIIDAVTGTTIWNFLGTTTGGTAQYYPDRNLLVMTATGESFDGGFILNGYNGQGGVDAQCGFSLGCSGNMNFYGVATPEPNSLVLLLSGAGILAGLIRRKMWA